mmetsp:Transcript_111818/g.280101  ORF Transcript_111818/g.280101 Transcript_111818/m.280101 type:complete len:296 (+) Transcript_111818:134-1021(+)
MAVLKGPRGMWQAEEDGRRSLLREEAAGVASTPSPDQGMLQDYSAEFSRLRGVAATKVAALKNAVGGSSWAEDARAAERALQAMETNRRQVQVQLRLELSGAAGSARQEWDKRLQEWAREVASFRGELEAAREQHNRQNLRLDGREVVAGGVDAASRSSRQSALQSTELMERGTQQLQEAVRQALETEVISNEVMDDLSSQRESISGIRGKMRTIGTELSQARQSLGRMLQRAQQNRLITLVICAVLGFALAFWALCFFGLPLKYTLMLAAATLVLCAAGIVLRSRLKARAATAG